MGGKAVGRTGGLAVGVVGAVALVVATESRSARPPDRLSFDIHAEYVKFLSGRDTITAYLAYPERKDPAPAVVVIHEIFGMSDFIRQTTEQLAKDGFVAIAPDTVTQDLDATVAYVKRLKAARSDRIGVIGFCWGGGQSFRYATNNPSLGAFVVCYGPGPDALSIARIRAKGLGVYAENDARINAGLADVDAAIRTYHKSYRYTVYPGVGHGFLRAREKPEVADSAWKAVVGFFRESLEH